MHTHTQAHSQENKQRGWVFDKKKIFKSRDLNSESLKKEMHHHEPYFFNCYIKSFGLTVVSLNYKQFNFVIFLLFVIRHSIFVICL